MISEEKPLVGSRPLMSGSSKAKPGFKIWLETEEGYVFGPGVYSLLRKIGEMGTLKGAAEALGMSYRFAWGLLKKAEEKLGEPLVESHKGGRSGGGGVDITDVGLRFLKEFSEVEQAINKFSESELPQEHGSLTIIEAEVLEMTAAGDRVVITFQLSEPTKLTLNLCEETVKSLEISPGDRLRLKVTQTVGDIEKINTY
jgi:molybdate transport system regulatory protein